MKVLFIEPCYPQFGGYFRAYNICYHLSLNQIKVDLLVSSASHFTLLIKKTKINPLLTQYELPRVWLNFYLNGRILRGIIATFFGLFGNYDIIHAAVPIQLESNIPAFFLKLIGKVVVMDWDDLWVDNYFNSLLFNKYIHFCELHAPRFFQNIVVVSDQLRNLAINRGAKNVIKLVNGVNTTQFKLHPRAQSRRRLKLDPKGKYLLTFGNSVAGKRGYLLFKTFEYIHKLDPSIKLITNINPTDIFDFYKINKKLFSSIISVGHIPESQLGIYLAAADATIFILSHRPNDLACFPIRIGSYLNGESIIIIQDNGSETTNTLKKYGCALMASDLQSLARRTVSLLNNQSQQSQLLANTKLAKKDLDWNKLIRPLIKYYSGLSKQRN